jgi:hypothetical protein
MMEVVVGSLEKKKVLGGLLLLLRVVDFLFLIFFFCFLVLGTFCVDSVLIFLLPS